MPSAAEILNTQTPATPTPEVSPDSAHQLDPSTAANSQWYGNVQNPELKGWLANKAYASPERLAESAYSLEKLFGADKAGRTAVLPKDENDIEGRKAFYAKIGVPETPEGYKLPLPAGDSGELAKAAATWFHENGVPAKAAESFTGKFNEFIENQVKQQEAAEKAKSETALNDLRVEWADKFDERAEFGRRGLKTIAREAGMEGEALDGFLKTFESTFGTATMLKMFNKIGELNREGSFNGGDGGGSFVMTKAQAQAQLEQYQADRAAGKINSFTWNTEYMAKGGKIDQLMQAMGMKE